MTYNCPICQSSMIESLGEAVHSNSKDHGITLFCANRKCAAQEVSAHGKNVKEAWEVSQLKFVRKDGKNE